MLLLVVGVLVLALVGGLVALLLSQTDPGVTPTAPTTTTTPRPTSDPASAKAQAEALDAALDQSARGRALVARGLADLGRCQRQSAALKDLRRAIKVRQRALKMVEDTPLDKLPRSYELRAKLVGLLRISVKADESYIAWGKTSRPCGETTSNRDWKKAETYSGRATTLKKAFLKQWKPIARKYKLPNRGDGDI